jgi:hypothetical protein
VPKNGYHRAYLIVLDRTLVDVAFGGSGELCLEHSRDRPAIAPLPLSASVNQRAFEQRQAQTATCTEQRQDCLHRHRGARWTARGPSPWLRCILADRDRRFFDNLGDCGGLGDVD